MRRALCFALFLAAGCGALPDEPSPYASGGAPIIGGRACGLDEEPATVAVLVEAKFTYGGTTQPVTAVICTGTLIAPDTVVSAAHCVDPAIIGGGVATVSAMKFFVSFRADLSKLADGQSTDVPSDALAVRSWVENPAFALPDSGAGPQDSHDVSLLFLDHAVSTPPEIVIQPEEAAQIVPGASVRIAGYGQQTMTAAYQRPPDGTIGVKECATSSLGEVGTFEMQVGGESLPRKCHGDSGGPTFLEVTTPFAHKRRLVGITSHSYDETDCQKGGIDTRVDAVRAWIDGEMTKACARHARAWCEVPGVVPAKYWDDLAVTNRRPSCRCDGGSSVGALALAVVMSRRRKRRR